MAQNNGMAELLDKQKLLEDVEAALDDIRPHLAVDGGNVELVDITDERWVKIKWLGSCSTCNMTAMTMQAGIAESIKNKVSGIAGVEAINDPNSSG